MPRCLFGAGVRGVPAGLFAQPQSRLASLVNQGLVVCLFETAAWAVSERPRLAVFPVELALIDAAVGLLVAHPFMAGLPGLAA